MENRIKKLSFVLIVLLGLSSYALSNTVEDYKEACQKQDAQGCLNLGLAYAKGIEIERDYELAKDFLEPACDLGNTQACTELKDIDQHHQRVFSEHEQFCIEGDKNGCYQLGIAYRDGLGVRQDAEAAKEYFKMACDMGDTQACSEMNAKDQNHNESSNPENKEGNGVELARFTAQSPVAKLGEKAFYKGGCSSCHIIGKASSGPDLTGALTRHENGEKWVADFIKNPEHKYSDEYVSGMIGYFNLKMPNQSMSDQEIKGIIEYMKWVDKNAHLF